MTRIHKPGDDGPEPEPMYWALARPTVVDTSERATTARTFLRGLNVYPTFVLPVTGTAWAGDRADRRCEVHRGRVWAWRTVAFFGLGYITVGGTINRGGVGEHKMASAHLDPEAANAAASLADELPDWLLGVPWDREASFRVRRIEHVLHALLVTVYAADPRPIGGRCPIVSDYCRKWSYAHGMAVCRSDGLDMTNPGTWEF